MILEKCIIYIILLLLCIPSWITKRISTKGELSRRRKHNLFIQETTNKAQTDIGYTVSSNSFQVDMFDGFDVRMLGDIHKETNFW